MTQVPSLNWACQTLIGTGEVELTWSEAVMVNETTFLSPSLAPHWSLATTGSNWPLQPISACTVAPTCRVGAPIAGWLKDGWEVQVDAQGEES